MWQKIKNAIVKGWNIKAISIVLVVYMLFSLAGFYKLNEKINNMSVTSVSSTDELNMAISEIENIKEDINKHIVKVVNKDGSTIVNCITPQQENVYTIYQLPMNDNAGGNCYAITEPNGKLIMIDGGYEVDGVYVADFIKNHGGEVEAWILTHPHNDHIGAFIYNMNQPKQNGIKVDTVYYSPFTEDYFTKAEDGKDLVGLNKAVLFNDFEKLRKAGKQKYIPMTVGDVVTMNDITITCMNSFDETIWDVNANSLAMNINIKDITMLYCADITDQSIANMRARLGDHNELWNVDFIQLPHHGYIAGVDDDSLYRITMPEMALVDCSSLEYETDVVNIKKHLEWLNHMGIPVIKRFEGPNRIVID